MAHSGSADKRRTHYYSKATMMYFEEIGKISLLSKDEFQSLLSSYRHGNMEARNRILEANLRLVISIALKYDKYLNCLDFLDIIQAGNEGMIKALENYDEKKGAFSNYAGTYIKCYISDLIKSQNRSVQYPFNLEEAVTKYRKLEKEYLQQNTHLPSQEELCQILGISKNTLANVQMILQNRPVSFEEYSQTHDCSLEETLPDKKNWIDEAIEWEYGRNMLVLLKQKLTLQEYYFYYHYYCNERPLEDIAQDFLVSKEVASKKIQKIRGKILQLQENKTSQQKISALPSKVKKKINLHPIRLDDIAKYEFIKSVLTWKEKQFFYLKYVIRNAYTISDYARELEVSCEEIQEIYCNVQQKVATYFQDKGKYITFKKFLFELMGTSIFDCNLDNSINYYKLFLEYETKSYEKIKAEFQDIWDDLKTNVDFLFQRYFSSKGVISEDDFIHKCSIYFGNLLEANGSLENIISSCYEKRKFLSEEKKEVITFIFKAKDKDYESIREKIRKKLSYAHIQNLTMEAEHVLSYLFSISEKEKTNTEERKKVYETLNVLVQKRDNVMISSLYLRLKC